MIALVLASTLMLSPVVHEDTDVRAVAIGTGDDEVRWLLDGHEVARSRDGEAVSFAVAKGRHDLHAVSGQEGAWEIMARPEPRGAGATFVQAWTARHEPAAPPADVPWRPPSMPDWAAAGAFAVLGLGILLWPERRPGPRRRETR